MSLRRIASCFAALLVLFGGYATAQSLSRSAGTSPRAPARPAEAPEGSCPPSTIFFTQMSNQTPVAANGVACRLDPPNPEYHLANSFWRSFRLEDHGILGPVQICEIQFGVEQAVTPGAAGQPITFNVGVSLGDPFPLGFRYQLGTFSTTLPDMSLQIFTVPVAIQVPAGSEVYVEVHVPDGVENEYILYPGGNPESQTAPSYISAEGCGIVDPTRTEEIGFSDSHFLINFRGTEIPITPPALVLDADPNTVVEVGETTTLGTTWTNFFAGPQNITSTFESVHASGGLTKSLPDTTADYGLMPVGTPTSCVSTGNCAQVTAGGTKSLGVDEDLFVAETLILPPAAVELGAFPDKIWDIHIGGSFADVPTANLFYAFIENIFHNGVTGGCSGGNYCPGNATLRKQMAVFLLKSLEGATYLPPPATGIFDDVLDTDPFAPWIEDLYGREITGGCAGGPPPAPISYCPDQAVKRKQMAVFLLKTKEGSSYVPPAPTDIFDDVPADGFQPWIEELYNRAITGGCAGGPPPAPISYCPENSVTRGQMAPFLVKTFGLLLYGP